MPGEVYASSVNVVNNKAGLVTFDVPAQPAHQALTEFARQANITLLFPIDVAETQRVSALNGQFSIADGLSRLLSGTNLFLVAGKDGLYTVKVRDTAATAPSSATDTQNPIEGSRDPDATAQTKMEYIAVVGTRSSPRTVQDSPVPLDILSSTELRSAGVTDALSVITSLVPSLNANDQPINDASTLVRPANLRGLASDHTLLLLNGKRYHRSAAITFLGGGLSDGAQGPDMSTIPLSAVSQIEILRDGAAAQYGSDAIAGVINFSLKDHSDGGSVLLHYGGFSEGDGDITHLQANIGLPLAAEGFINLSAEFRQQNPTSRSVQRADAQTLINNGNTFVDDPAQIWGSPDINDDLKLAVNFGVPTSSSLEWYGFANIAKRDMLSGFYFRNPHTRKQVFDGGVTETGEALLLIADLDGLQHGIECPQVTINDGNVLDDPDYLLIADPTTALGQNCFAFNEMLPGGFTPLFGGELSDYSAYTGLRWETGTNWLVDFSVSYGRSEVAYRLENTINPSLGPDTPFSFQPGTAIQSERDARLDLSKEIDVTSGAINLASGIEYRHELFEQREGDVASYEVGPLAWDPVTRSSQGFAAGSNGFTGFRPAAAGKWSRGNLALYADIEFMFDRGFMLGMAARYEHFTDFGSTFDGKVATRIQLNDAHAIRGSISSGFKAPTVGQSNVINVTTAFFTSRLEDQITLPPTSELAQNLGASRLSPEESINTSIGWVGELSDRLFITLDYFNINMTDRISTTSAIPIFPEDRVLLEELGLEDVDSFSSAKFFTNDFDTRTQGIDLVGHYDVDWSGGKSRFSLLYNWTETEVEDISQYLRIDANGEVAQQPNITQQRIRMLEENLPHHRASFTISHQTDPVTILLRANYFGSYYEDHVDASAGYDIFAGSEWTFDTEFSITLNTHLTLTAGAKNIFDNRPDRNPFADLVGAEYPLTSPMGINGGFYYFRALYEF